MIEKDTIQELFSKTFENHSAPVKPELWAGVQAKMSAAGTAGGAAAAKGLSALAKWAIGSAALTGAAVVTTLAVLNSGTETKQPIQAQQSNPVQTENSTKENPAGVDSPTNNNNTATTSAKEKTFLFPTPTIMEWKQEPYDVEDWSLQAGIWSPPATIVNGIDNEETTVNSNSSAEGAETKGSENKGAPNVGESQPEVKSYAPAKIELPNVFTPNGDGDNDIYKFIAIENVKSLEMSIFDGNGKLVFKSINENEFKIAWDGTILDGSDQAPEGIYSSQIIYRDLGDDIKTKTSYIYLKRKSGF